MKNFLRLINQQAGIPDSLVSEFILTIKRDTIKDVRQLLLKEGIKGTKSGQRCFRELGLIKDKLNVQIKQEEARNTG